jgi:hypothetical protein
MFSKIMIRFAYGVKLQMLQYPSNHATPRWFNPPISGNTNRKRPNA